MASIDDLKHLSKGVSLDEHEINAIMRMLAGIEHTPLVKDTSFTDGALYTIGNNITATLYQTDGLTASLHIDKKEMTKNTKLNLKTNNQYFHPFDSESIQHKLFDTPNIVVTKNGTALDPADYTLYATHIEVPSAAQADEIRVSGAEVRLTIVFTLSRGADDILEGFSVSYL